MIINISRKWKSAGLGRQAPFDCRSFDGGVVESAVGARLEVNTNN